MNLYVWGTGCAAGDLIDAGLAAERVTAFLDSEARGGSFLGRPVLRPEAVDTASDFFVLVASRHVEEIVRKAAACGIGEDRLLFLRDNWTLTDRNTNYDRARELLPPALLASLQTPPRAPGDPPAAARARKPADGAGSGRRLCARANAGAAVRRT